MPTLTTLDGKQLRFSAFHVNAVTDRDIGTGEDSTCIYGLEDGIVKIAASPEKFISGLENRASFFKTALLNGHPVWINGAAVESIRQPEPEEYPVAVKSVLTLGKLKLASTMEIDAITALVNAHGGKF